MASELFDRLLVRVFVPLTVRKVVGLASWSWLLSIATWVSTSNIIGMQLRGGAVSGGVELSVIWAFCLAATAVILFQVSLARIESAYKRMALRYGQPNERVFE